MNKLVLNCVILIVVAVAAYYAAECQRELYSNTFKLVVEADE